MLPGRYCWFKEMLPPKWQRGVVYLRTQIRHRFKTKLMCSLYVPSMGGEKSGDIIEKEFVICPAAIEAYIISPVTVIFSGRNIWFSCEMDNAIVQLYGEPTIKLVINKIEIQKAKTSLLLSSAPRNGTTVSLQCFIYHLKVAHLDIPVLGNIIPQFVLDPPTGIYMYGFSPRFDSNLLFYPPNTSYESHFLCLYWVNGTRLLYRTKTIAKMSSIREFPVKNIINGKTISLKIVELKTLYSRIYMNDTIEIKCIVNSVNNYSHFPMLAAKWFLMDIEVKLRPPIILGDTLHINGSVFDGNFCFMCTLWEIQLKEYNIEHCFDIMTKSLLKYVIKPWYFYNIIPVKSGDKIQAILAPQSQQHDFPRTVYANISKVSLEYRYCYKVFTQHIQTCQSPYSENMNLTLVSEFNLYDGFEVVYLIVPYDLEIDFPRDGILFVEDEEFSFVCNLKFGKIGDHFPQLFSWRKVIDNTYVSGQTLRLTSLDQARLKYKCEFNSGSIKLEKELDIIIVERSEIRLHVISPNNRTVFYLTSEYDDIICALHPNILWRYSKFRNYWSSSLTNTFTIENFMEGKYNDNCTSNIKGVSTIFWEFLLINRYSKLIFTADPSWIDDIIPTCEWNVAWMNTYISTHLQPTINLTGIYGGKKSHYCNFDSINAYPQTRYLHADADHEHSTNKIVIDAPMNYTVFEKSSAIKITCKFSHKVYNAAFYNYLRITLNEKLNKWRNEVHTHLLDEGVYHMHCFEWNLYFDSSTHIYYNFTVIDDTLKLKIDGPPDKIYFPEEERPLCVWNKPLINDPEAIQAIDEKVSTKNGITTLRRNCIYKKFQILRTFTGLIYIASSNQSMIYVNSSVGMLKNMQMNLKPVSCFVSAYLPNPISISRMLTWYSIQPHYVFQNVPQHQKSMFNITSIHEAGDYGTYICAGWVGKTFYSFIYTIISYQLLEEGIITPFRRKLIGDEMVWCNSRQRLKNGVRTTLSVVERKKKKHILFKYENSAILSVDIAKRAEITCKISQGYLSNVLSYTSSSFALVIIPQRYTEIQMNDVLGCKINGPRAHDMTITFNLMKVPNYFQMPPDSILRKSMLTGGTFIFGCILSDDYGIIWMEYKRLITSSPPTTLILIKSEVGYNETFYCRPNGFPLTEVVSNIASTDPSVVLHQSKIPGEFFLDNLNDYGPYNIFCHSTGFHSSNAFDLKANLTIMLNGVKYEKMTNTFIYESDSYTMLALIKVLPFLIIFVVLFTVMYRSTNTFIDKKNVFVNYETLMNDAASKILGDQEYTFFVTKMPFNDMMQFLTLISSFDEYLDEIEDNVISIPMNSRNILFTVTEFSSLTN